MIVKTLRYYFLLFGICPLFFVFSWVFEILEARESPFFYKTLGDHYRRLNFWEDALGNYQKSIDLKMNCNQCYYWKGWVYLQKGAYFEALNELSWGMRLLKNQSKKAPSFLYSNQNYYDIILLKLDVYHAIYMEKISLRSYATNKIQELFATLHKNLSFVKTKKKKNRFMAKIHFYEGKYNFQLSDIKRVEKFEQAALLQYRPAISYYFQYLLYKKNNQKHRAKWSMARALREEKSLPVKIHGKIAPLIFGH